MNRGSTALHRIKRTTPVVWLRLANVRLLPRIDRAKAQGIVDAFLQRVRHVNARADLLYRVPMVHAFGSFITGAPDLGDIDLAFNLEGKQAEIEQAGGDWIAALLARAKASGKRLSTYDDKLSYGEREVQRLLRARNPYLSFHSFCEIEKLQIESQCIFPRCTSNGGGHADTCERTGAPARKPR
jgi:hypothetical protein